MSTALRELYNTAEDLQESTHLTQAESFQVAAITVLAQSIKDAFTPDSDSHPAYLEAIAMALGYGLKGQTIAQSMECINDILNAQANE